MGGLFFKFLMNKNWIVANVKETKNPGFGRRTKGGFTTRTNKSGLRFIYGIRIKICNLENRIILGLRIQYNTE